MSSPPIWVRNFVRSEKPDVDTVASAEFMKDTFTDFFGVWLQKDQNAVIFNFDELVRKFWSDSEFKTDLYAAADGCFIKYEEDMGWFNNNLRFLAVVYPACKSPFQAGSWTFIIAGSKHLTGKREILDVVSMDSRENSKDINELKFYERDEVRSMPGTLGWVYNGKSSEAFGEAKSYLGAFGGHVNGALVLKELNKPWYHWKSSHQVLEPCLRPDQRTSLSHQNAPYITTSEGNLFSGVFSAERLQSYVIQPGADAWYTQRRVNDFKSNSTSVKIKRWMAHYLLTTTVNLATGTADSDGSYYAPLDHFFNHQLLSKIKFLPEFTHASFGFTFESYKKAIDELQLVLMQCYDTKKFPNIERYPTKVLPQGALGGGKRTGLHDQIDFVVMQEGEGGLTDNECEFPFVALQASYEDSLGVLTTQGGLRDGVRLLSEKTENAIYMLDFWNPVYSWRRGVLMQYVPETTTYDERAREYDLDATFVRNIKESQYARVKGSPERSFLELRETSLQDMQARMSKYFKAVTGRLQRGDGLLEYLTLAECRRRIYRPFPLDEYGYTLPYALKYPRGDGLYEMGENGFVRLMEARGVTFLTSWTSTLSGYDPQILGTGPFPPKPSGCPFARHCAPGVSCNSRPLAGNPTWDDDIKPLFSAPDWISHEDREAKGASWIHAMKKYGFDCDLSRYEDVSAPSKAITIYQHLRSKSMPITQNPAEYFPDDALENFRTWVNQGFRRTLKDPIERSELIPLPNDAPVSFRHRKDITTLTPVELQKYRAKLDDILRVGELDNSIWQELGTLHAEWCLHYQEATFLWHRAYLMYVESLIGFPIPYWNGFATASSDPESAYAGIPPMFLEETYVHPSGETRKNPLRYALSLGGKSKQGSSRYVVRDPILVEGKSHPDWATQVLLFKKYHQQIAESLSQTSFSSPQGIGVPWTQILQFTDDNPNYLYKYRGQDFDGTLEQPHDNYHGWVGPDMGDNSYTGFDPIFLNYHANMDRIVNSFILSHPNSTFTSNFPLRPFTDQATKLNYTEHRVWRYTTIGDMAKPAQALGYMYGPPASPDYIPLLGEMSRGVPCPESKSPVSTGEKPVPYVVFTGAGCTQKSYAVDVFTEKAAASRPDAEDKQYIGRVTWLGMGPKAKTAKARCGAPEQRNWRMLNAGSAEEELKDNAGLKLVVTDLESGEKVEESVWKAWDAFEGQVVWMTK